MFAGLKAAVRNATYLDSDWQKGQKQQLEEDGESPSTGT